MRRRTRWLIGAVAALSIGLGSGAAYAHFTSSGHGSGAATVGTPSPVTVVAASGTVSSDLQPGSSADLLIEVDNPDSQSLTLTGLSENGSTVTVVGGSGCTTSGVSVPTVTGLSITVPPGTNVIHVPNGAAMSASSVTGCQGATFRIPVLITVQEG
jgi:hypothetical protein